MPDQPALPTLIVVPDPAALASAAAERLVAAAGAAIERRGRFAVALSGGSTPRALYAELATRFGSRIDWSRVHLFWGDERNVPPDHPDSNFGMAREALLRHLAIPEANVHRIRGEADPSRAADDYQDMLIDFFGGEPRFDMVLLGMGDDGHTASLFPSTTAIWEPSDRYCAATFVDKLDAWRVTLTAGAINTAEQVVFLVAGAAKAGRLREVLRGAFRPNELPAQLIRPTQGQVVWLVDQAAAADMPT
jgi:6-phosphogluconolactonase